MDVNRGVGHVGSELMKKQKNKEKVKKNKNFEAEKWAKDNLKVEKVNYKDIPEDVASFINTTIDNAYKDYPILKRGFIQKINIYNALKRGGEAEGYCEVKDGKYITELKLLKKCFSGKTPKNKIKLIIRHEMVHFLEFALNLKKYGAINSKFKVVDKRKLKDAYNSFEKEDIAKEIKSTAFNNIRVYDSEKIKKLTKSVLSEYAPPAPSNSEFLAEAVVAFKYQDFSKLPVELAKLLREVDKLLKEKIEKIGNGL